MRIFHIRKIKALAIFAATLVGVVSAHAASILQPNISYEGHLIDTTLNQPFDFASTPTTIYFQVITGGTCVLYQESTTSSSTSGDINYVIGSSTNGVSNNKTLVDVFSDVSSISGVLYSSTAPGTNLIGATACSASNTEARTLRVSVVQNSTIKVTGDVTLSSVPMALTARSVSKDFFNSSNFTLTNGTFISLGTISGLTTATVFGSSNSIPSITVDAYGRVTALSESSLSSFSGTSSGTFTGKVAAGAGSTISSGTIVISAINASNITSGTITNSKYSGVLVNVTSATFSGSVDFSGTAISGLNVGAGTFSGFVTAGSGSSITLGTFTGGNIINSTISNSNIFAGVSTAGTFVSSVLTSATLSGGVHNGGSFAAGTFTPNLITGGTIASATINSGVHNGGSFSTGTYNSSVMNGGNITTATITTATLNAPKINNGTFSGNLDLLNATLVTAGSGCIYSDSTGNLSLAACSGAGGVGTVTKVSAGTGLLTTGTGIVSSGTISIDPTMTGLVFSGTNSYTGSNTFTTIKVNGGTFSGVLSSVSVATFAGPVDFTNSTLDFSGATSNGFKATNGTFSGVLANVSAGTISSRLDVSGAAVIGLSATGGTITNGRFTGVIGSATASTFSGTVDVSGASVIGLSATGGTITNGKLAGSIYLSSGTLATPSVGTGGGCLAVSSAGVFSITSCSGGGGGGSGTVTNIGLTMPSDFSVSATDFSTNGTFAVTYTNQNANKIFSGPASGGAASPTFRTLTMADLPILSGIATPLTISANFSQSVTVTGAVVGDFVTCSIKVASMASGSYWRYASSVTAADTVTVSGGVVGTPGNITEIKCLVFQ